VLSQMILLASGHCAMAWARPWRISTLNARIRVKVMSSCSQKRKWSPTLTRPLSAESG
jgi:hypothetical protein